MAQQSPSETKKMGNIGFSSKRGRAFFNFIFEKSLFKTVPYWNRFLLSQSLNV